MGLITYCTLFLLGMCNAQSSSTFGKNYRQFKGKYVEFLDEGEKEVRVGYHFVFSKTSAREYMLRVFYPEKKLLTKEWTFKDKNGKIKHGPARLWHENGHKKGEGSYKNNEFHGTWKWYHRKTGNLSSEGAYLDGKVHGEWKNFDSKGRLWGVYNYEKGIHEGAFYRYDTLGVEINSGIYHADTVFSQTNLKDITDKNKLEIRPCLSECKDVLDDTEREKCSSKALLDHIYADIKYPYTERMYGLEGTALIRFTVTIEGGIKDIEVITGLSEGIEEECLRVVNMMPLWEAGKVGGEKVNVYFNLPIKFKLE